MLPTHSVNRQQILHNKWRKFSTIGEKSRDYSSFFSVYLIFFQNIVVPGFPSNIRQSNLCKLGVPRKSAMLCWRIIESLLNFFLKITNFENFPDKPYKIIPSTPRYVLIIRDANVRQGNRPNF